jgi:hypothetical protein
MSLKEQVRAAHGRKTRLNPLGVIDNFWYHTSPGWWHALRRRLLAEGWDHGKLVVTEIIPNYNYPSIVLCVHQLVATGGQRDFGAGVTFSKSGSTLLLAHNSPMEITAFINKGSSMQSRTVPYSSTIRSIVIMPIIRMAATVICMVTIYRSPNKFWVFLLNLAKGSSFLRLV